MECDERLGPQHYKILAEAFARDYQLGMPVNIVKIAVISHESRTRLRFNSLFAIDEFVVMIELTDSNKKSYQAEIECGLWVADQVLEVFESRLLT